MNRGIGLLERPVLTMRVLLFLQERKEGSLSDMISQGWNRSTTEASLQRARNLRLVATRRSGSFPRFEKRHCLTGKGRYAAKFVRLLETQAKSCFQSPCDDFCRFPKGCMRLLVYMCRKGWTRISDVSKGLSMSPNQIYRCMSFMEVRKILRRKITRMGRRSVSSFELSNRGILLAAAADALDRSLRAVVNESPLRDPHN